MGFGNFDLQNSPQKFISFIFHKPCCACIRWHMFY